MQRLVVERFMDDASAGPPVYGQPYHTCDMVQVALDEALSAIEGINPNDHVLLIDFVGEFEEVPRCLRCFLLVDALHLVQVFSVALLVHLVVCQQNLLRNVVLVDLIGEHVGITGIEIAYFILLTNNGGFGVNLSEVELDCILDMHVCQREDV